MTERNQHTLFVLAPDGGEQPRAPELEGIGFDVVVGEAGPLTLVLGGEDLIREALERGARRVLAIVESVDRRLASSLLDAGASGVVVAGTPASAIGDALRAVAAGFVVLPEAARQAGKHPVLTTRQQEILKLLVLGLSNAEIASRLYLTEATVKTHLRALFAKLEVRSRKEAIDLVLHPGSSFQAGVLGITGVAGAESEYKAPQIR